VLGVVTLTRCAGDLVVITLIRGLNSDAEEGTENSENGLDSSLEVFGM